MKFVFLAVGLAVAGMFLAAGIQSGAHRFQRNGTVTIDRGLSQNVYDTAWAGQQMFETIVENPTAAVYVLTARDRTGEQLELTVDITNDRITRRHLRSDKRWTTEVWDGYVMDRVKSAASGESLNHTPRGMSFSHPG